MSRLAIVIIITLAATAAQGTTINVPSMHPTIQAAIDASIEFDTVLVAQGTYTGPGNLDLDFGGRDIVVMSENGPEVTIIDCQGTEAEPHRGLYFHSGESNQAVLQGFTITNGYAINGGAISCVNSSPTIRDNIVTNCRAAHYGAGIHCTYSNSQILGNTITENIGSDIGGDGGGGISLIYCNNVLIDDNIISGNFSYSGGGIDCFGANVSIQSNTIKDNLAYDGAAIGLCCGSSGTISSNTIVGNLAMYNGGAIYCNSGADPAISNNVILGNTAYTPFSFGGGICCKESNPNIIHNTIVSNAAASGGGLACRHLASPRVERTIIAFNGNGGAAFTEATASPVFAHCDLYGNEGGDWMGSIADQLWMDGNMSIDPMFCDADNGNYQISVYSPCAPGVQPNLELIGALPTGCGTVLCGDTDGNGELTETDLQRLYDFYFFCNADWPYPISSGDLDCDDMIRLNDIILLAGYIHGYGPAPCCDPTPRSRPELMQHSIDKQ